MYDFNNSPLLACSVEVETPLNADSNRSSSVKKRIVTSFLWCLVIRVEHPRTYAHYTIQATGTDGSESSAVLQVLRSTLHKTHNYIQANRLVWARISGRCCAQVRWEYGFPFAALVSPVLL